MIQRWNEKLPVCSYCLQPGHTAFKCGKKPQKGLQTYRGLKVSSSFGGKRKPLRQVSEKTAHQKRITKKKWMAANPAAFGVWTCYLQISPDCPKQVNAEALNLEHVLSKVRHPELRYDISNIRPACRHCNKLKGSKDWVDGQLV